MVRGVRVHTTFLRRGWGRGHGTFPMPGGGMPHFLCLGRGGLGGMGHVKNPQKIVGDQIWLHTGASEESIGAIGAEFRSASNGPCPARSSTYIYIIICILWCRVGTIVTIRSVPPFGGTWPSSQHTFSLDSGTPTSTASTALSEGLAVVVDSFRTG